MGFHERTKEVLVDADLHSVAVAGDADCSYARVGGRPVCVYVVLDLNPSQTTVDAHAQAGCPEEQAAAHTSVMGEEPC